MLRGLAQSKLRGMTPDGSPLAGQFAPGQVLEQTFNLQPGRCYAVVGVGIGITELDVEIILHQPPAPAYSAAKDDTSGPQAVLGGRRDCFRSPLPFAAPAKVKLKASSGAGVGVAQLFIR